MTRCDALVVGGGPAGSTCARVLGRAGWNVLVLDRARFPRDKPCAEYLSPQASRILEAMGVLGAAGAGDEFSASNAFQTGKVAMNVDGEWRTAEGSWLLGFVSVECADIAPQVYFLPLSVAWGDDDERGRQ